MKKLLIYFLLLSSALCQAQTQRHLYDIRGNAYQTSPKTMAICFDTYVCHGCMNTLADFCKQYHTQHPEVQVVILIKGAPYTGTRRSLTAYLRDYYTDEERPVVVYDLNPTQRKQYFNKHKIKQFPALLIFSDKQNKECFISEQKLFAESEIGFHISEYATKKIEDYLK